jgi:GEVED domain/Secretion system C-terminal sorting domain
LSSNVALTIRDRVTSTCSTAVSITRPAPCVQVPPPPPPPNDPVAYCAVISNFPWHEWINIVTLNTDIINASGKTAYSDFTSKQANLTIGASNVIKLNGQFSWVTYAEYWKVWIDYNQNGVFESPSELVWNSTSIAPNTGNGNAITETTGSFSVPSNAKIGTTRMRVIMSRNDFTSACANVSYGEVEDYSVKIASTQTGNNVAADLLNLFTAKEQGSAIINWLIRFDNGIDRTQLERSPDGVHFYRWGSPIYSGDLSGETKDSYPYDGSNFYRLRLDMTDGTVIYSNVSELTFDNNHQTSLFPIPANDEVWFNAEKYYSEDLTVLITDMRGVQISKIDFENIQERFVRLDLKNIPNGMFQVSLISEKHKVVSKKLIVEHVN